MNAFESISLLLEFLREELDYCLIRVFVVYFRSEFRVLVTRGLEE